MKLVFPNLELDGENQTVEFDFSVANTRMLIKVLARYPEIIPTCAANLRNYEAYAGYNPEVKVDARTDAVLRKIICNSRQSPTPGGDD